MVASAVNIYAEVHGGGDVGLYEDLEVTSLISDPTGTDHYYFVKVNRGFSEFYVDQDLIAVIVHGADVNSVIQNNTEPYSVGLTKARLPARMPNLMENGTDNLWKIRPEDIRMSEGFPAPTRKLSLYNEGTTTEWSNLATGGAVQTSHPVPIMGYGRKTAYVQADAAGDVDIDLYLDGDWRTYDSVTLTANELEHYTLPAEVQAPLMRLVYTPTDADTITLGEVGLA